MRIHVRALRAEGLRRTAWRPGHALLATGLPGTGLFFILALAILAVGSTLAARAGAGVANDLSFQQAVIRALDARTSDGSARLVRASTTFWGDVAVEFVLRDEGGADVSRAAAMADSVAIARAVYETPQVRPLNVTVLGLAANPSPAVGSVPVLYASWPADRLVGLDWRRVWGEDASALAGVRWLPAGVCQAWHECAPERPAG
jgi:hypothetical protein